jgi:multiple sugar transport system ATP-binding protein
LAAVALRGVYKDFGRTRVIHGVDLDIADGEFVVFVGPSGCGKSTLLRLIAGLEDITAGDLFIGGERVTDLPPARRGIAMVFQSYALYPHMTVYQNMAFGLELARASREEADRRVRRVAEMLHIAELLDRKPRELSGGQRQRVAIGRAIVRDPQVFLFDEPLSNLDAALRVGTRIEIAKLHEETGATMVYVTHDQVEAMTLADRIVVLNAGRVEQVGAPLALYHRPANLFVAGFIGSPRMNFLPGTLAAGEGGPGCRLGDGTFVPLPERAAAPAGSPVTLGVRPEHLRVDAPGGGAPGGAAIEGRVDFVEQLGELHLLYVRTGDAVVAAKGPGTARHRAGDPVRLAIAPATCHLFDGQGRAIEGPQPRPDGSPTPT